MMNERLSNIIKTFESENRSFSESIRLGEEIDSMNITVEDIQIVAGIFDKMLPEKVKLSVAAICTSVKEFAELPLAAEERNRKQEEIFALFESSKVSISYINYFNRIVIADDYNPNLLEQLNRFYDFPEYDGSFHSFREQYIEEQAEAYIQGHTNDTISYLLKSKNTTFYEILGFAKELKTAVTLTERERLKKKMQFLDELEAFDLPESEIKAAMAQSERERLKDVMRKIDAEEESKVKDFSIDETLPEYKKTKPSASIIPIEKNKFRWKRYAVAASVIGLIAIATVIVYNNKKKSFDIARNKPNTSDTTSIINRHQVEPDILASNKWDSTEMVWIVKKEAGLGFAVKEEKITVHIYTPKEKNQIDPLKKLDKTYTFKNYNLSVYLAADELTELFKIDNQYYIEINGTFYYIRLSNKPAMLNKITNPNILTRIDKIKYQQDNK